MIKKRDFIFIFLVFTLIFVMVFVQAEEFTKEDKVSESFLKKNNDLSTLTNKQVAYAMTYHPELITKEHWGSLTNEQTSYIIENNQDLIKDWQWAELKSVHIENNLNEINDISKLSANNLNVALRNKFDNSQIDFRAIYPCTINEDAIIKAKTPEGNFNEFEMNPYPEGAIIAVDKDGIIRIYYNIKYKAEAETLLLNEKYFDDNGNLNLPEGIRIEAWDSGRLIIDNSLQIEGGSFYMKNGRTYFYQTLRNDALLEDDYQGGIGIYLSDGINIGTYMGTGEEIVMLKNKEDIGKISGNCFYSEEDYFYMQSDYLKDTSSFFVNLGAYSGFEEDMPFLDKNSGFSIYSIGGDSVEIFSGRINYEEQKIIPKMIVHSYENSTSFTSIMNGFLEFNDFNDEINFEYRKDMREIGRMSIPIEIETSSLSQRNSNIRIGTGNVFAIVEENDLNNPVVFNTYNIPISNLIDDETSFNDFGQEINIRGNNFRTLEDFYGKWPNIEFQKVSSNYDKGSDPIIFSKLDSGLDPYTVRLFDLWLQTNPDALKYSKIDENGKIIIGITNEGSFNYENIVAYDPQSLDVYESKFQSTFDQIDRTLIYPTSSLNHEMVHLMDYGVKNEEKEMMMKIPFNERENIKRLEDIYSETYSEIYNKIQFSENAKKEWGDVQLLFAGEDVPVYRIKYDANVDGMWTDMNKHNFDEYSGSSSVLSNIHAYLWNMNKAAKLSDEEFQEVFYKEVQELFDVLTEESGVPAIYSSSGGSLPSGVIPMQLGEASELATTYREETINERRDKVNTGTDAQKQVYKRLTQVAFDSGQMSFWEYSNVMQDVHPELKNIARDNIYDFQEINALPDGNKKQAYLELYYGSKCKEYTLLCCEKYPQSLHCKNK